jgi:hypothetical protein
MPKTLNLATALPRGLNAYDAATGLETIPAELRASSAMPTLVSITFPTDAQRLERSTLC